MLLLLTILLGPVLLGLAVLLGQVRRPTLAVSESVAPVQRLLRADAVIAAAAVSVATVVGVASDYALSLDPLRAGRTGFAWPATTPIAAMMALFVLVVVVTTLARHRHDPADAQVRTVSVWWTVAGLVTPIILAGVVLATTVVGCRGSRGTDVVVLCSGDRIAAELVPTTPWDVVVLALFCAVVCALCLTRARRDPAAGHAARTALAASVVGLSGTVLATVSELLTAALVEPGLFGAEVSIDPWRAALLLFVGSSALVIGLVSASRLVVPPRVVPRRARAAAAA